jgi:hypothetical protein
MMEALIFDSPAINADPFPYYEILREQSPCYWSSNAFSHALLWHGDAHLLIFQHFRLF